MSLAENSPSLPLLWGASEIAAALGVSRRAAFHLLSTNAVPGAQRIGGRWCLNIAAFTASFAASNMPTAAGGVAPVAPAREQRAAKAAALPSIAPRRKK